MRWNWSRSARSTARPGRPRSGRGLTLVELNVAVVVSAVLTTSVVMALVGGATLMTETRCVVSLKQDAFYALRVIERRVRGLYSDEVSVDDDGERLTIAVAGEPTRTFTKNGADLEYFDGAETVTLVSGTVQSLAFALEEGANGQDALLTVNLTLAQDGATSTVPECRILIRNRAEE